MPERPNQFTSCDVCERTILKGERAYEYVTPHGERLGVCELCRPRAEASGWIRAEHYGSVAQPAPGRARRGEALRQRLGRAASTARSAARGSRPRKAPEPAEPAEAVEHEAPESEKPASVEKPAGRKKPAGQRKPAAERPKRRPARQAKRQPKEQPKSPAAAVAKPRARRGPQALMRRAVERFNGSEEETRKVAGLIRSLGEPQAAVRADSSRQMALVTVAWELSWYQWEVSADGDAEPVREVAKGAEVSELTEDARTWNASVTEEGKLRLRSAAARSKASSKEA